MQLKNPKNIVILALIALIQTAAAQISERSGIFSGGDLGNSLVNLIDIITLVEIDTAAQAALFLTVLGLFYYAELNIFEQVFLRLEEIIKEAMGDDARGIYRDNDRYPTGVKGMAFAVAFISANGITGLIGLLAATAMGLIALLILLIVHGKLLGILGQFGIGDNTPAPEPRTAPTTPEPTPDPEPEPEWKPSEGIDVAVEDIISDIEEELEFEKHLMELDEQVIKDLEQALMYIQNNRGLIDNLMRIKFPNSQNDVSHEDLEHEMQAIKKSYDIDPTSKQATSDLKQKMKEIHGLLKDALEQLKKKDQALEKLINQNTNLSQKIENIDKKEREALQDAIDNLDKCWKYFENRR